MSNVSSGVFATVKRLPPNTGRIATVVAVALILLAFFLWGIVALYKATSGQPAAPEPQSPAAPEATATSAEASPKKANEKTKPAKAKTATEKTDGKQPRKPAAVSKAGDKPAAKQTPSKSSKSLKSSGIEVPSLYID